MKSWQLRQEKSKFPKIPQTVASQEKSMENTNNLPQVPQRMDDGSDHVEPPPAMELAPREERFWYDREPWAFRTTDWPDRIWLLESPPNYFIWHDRAADAWTVIDRRMDFAVIPPQKTLRNAMRIFFRKFRGPYPRGSGWFKQLMQAIGITYEDYLVECRNRYLRWWR
jgi:hypothetical protein